MQYKGLGTLEFLYSDGQYFFMEMNTRLQVEHPITEMITGWDLVMLQMQIFNPSHHFSLQQSDIVFNGHAIECRINAEDPTTFIPCAGRVSFYHPPGGFGVRVESALYHGSVVPPYYDSMIAKIITHGRTREQALCKMRLALEECVIEGLKTNLAFHMSVLSSPEFVSGHYTTCLLKQLGYHHS
jgi:acetyl-CoA carboxylase biotin carboxylase subunit